MPTPGEILGMQAGNQVPRSAGRGMDIGSMAAGALGGPAGAIGMGLVNNLSNLVFGGAIQRQQLKGQKKALEQQNAAAMDIWEKTNYDAQRKQMEKAGLNPALMYGMGGQAGGTVGTASGGGVGGAGAPMGIMNASEIAQLRLLEAQRQNIEADTANKQADTTNKPIIGENVATDTKLKMGAIGKLIVETDNEKTRGALLKLDERIKEVTQYYEMGKVEEEWKILVQNAREAQVDANVKGANEETLIDMVRVDYATRKIEAALKAAGIALTAAQINKINADIKTGFMNAEANKWNAETNAKNANNTGRKIANEVWANDMPESYEKVMSTLTGILQAVGLGTIMKGKQVEAPKPSPGHYNYQW